MRFDRMAGLSLAASLFAAVAPITASAQQATTTPTSPAPENPGLASPAPASPAAASPAPGAASGGTSGATSPAPTAAAEPAKPEPLVIYFDLGSASIRPQDMAVLDKASRLYSDAHPLVMIVSGATDSVGPAQFNLELSQRRAEAVLRGLVARGIPADRFQVLAKGGTEPTVATPLGVAEPRNRRVEIAWR